MTFSTIQPFDFLSEKKERIYVTVNTTHEVLKWTTEKQSFFKTEIKTFLSQVFPDEKDWSQFLRYYFQIPSGEFHRQFLSFRNGDGQLIASHIFDQGIVEYDGVQYKGIYIIVTGILENYQNLDIAKTIAIKLLAELRPDILMTTCAQSSALHSRINIVLKGVITDYDVFPRLENGKLISFPFKELDFAISVFKQLYRGFAENQEQRIDRAIKNLTVLMARKDIEMNYGFHPWHKNGRVDHLAVALGLTEKDGVLVIFRKKDRNKFP